MGVVEDTNCIDRFEDEVDSQHALEKCPILGKVMLRYLEAQFPEPEVVEGFPINNVQKFIEDTNLMEHNNPLLA